VIDRANEHQKGRSRRCGKRKTSEELINPEYKEKATSEGQA
jgi:hypothetical protein